MEALHRSPSPRLEGGSSRRRRGGFVFLRSPSRRPPATISAFLECACARRTTLARATLFLRRPVYTSVPFPPALSPRVSSRAPPLY